jgi:hypothetical protein
MASVQYLYFFSRLVLHCPSIFIEIIPQDDWMKKLLETWIERLDNMVNPKQRKATAMAFSRLLTFKIPQVYFYFEAILHVFIDILNDESCNVKDVE